MHVSCIHWPLKMSQQELALHIHSSLDSQEKPLGCTQWVCSGTMVWIHDLVPVPTFLATNECHIQPWQMLWNCIFKLLTIYCPFGLHSRQKKKHSMATRRSPAMFKFIQAVCKTRKSPSPKSEPTIPPEVCFAHCRRILA